MHDPEKHIVDYQRSLFELFNEFFARATGTTDVQDFASLETFSYAVRRKASDIGPRGEAAFRWVDDELRKFYARESVDAFKAARELGGLKLCLGGQSYFGQSQFDSVTSSLLYADTVLVPDPVLPWLESDRREERFRHGKLLEAAFSVLHLRPLVDTDLPYPACVVFPSWEKALEENDDLTWQALSQLVADVIARFVNPSVKSYEDAVDFVDSDPDVFIRKTEENSLFVAPGGNIGETITSSIDRYDNYLETWRDGDWLTGFRSMSLARKILYGISERIAPQFHIFENSEELQSNPLLSIEQHAHYFRLISNINSARLNEMGFLDQKRQALIDGFGAKRLQWLSNVPLNSLIQLRKNNENTNFRKRVEAVVKSMHESLITDVDRVAAELCHEISAAIAEHDQDMKDIQSRYDWLHGATAVGGGMALVAQLIPSLAPFLGPIAIPSAAGVVAKYSWDKSKERYEKNERSRSLLGVLAAARRENG